MPDDDHAETLRHRRVLLKLSGEALAGEAGFGIDSGILERIALELKDVRRLGAELAIVVGGGNIFRGVAASARGMDRTLADNMGMLATGINALALQDALENTGCPARVMSSIALGRMAEPFEPRRALEHLAAGRIVIFAGGTGSPFFSTDTAAALRALEIHAELMLKATKVDGVFDSDPVVNPNARMFETITYAEVLRRGLRVMDTTAVGLCMDNALPIRVFNLSTPGNIRRILTGQRLGTIVQSTGGQRDTRNTG